MRGGKREGAGRPKKYGSELVQIWVPKKALREIKKLLKKFVKDAKIGGG